MARMSPLLDKDHVQLQETPVFQQFMLVLLSDRLSVPGGNLDGGLRLPPLQSLFHLQAEAPRELDTMQLLDDFPVPLHGRAHHLADLPLLGRE